IIEISDGNIISDQPNVPEVEEHLEKQPLIRSEQKKISSWRSAVDRLGEAFRMALLAMNAHRMRTFLTMLGFIICIASENSVMAHKSRFWKISAVWGPIPLPYFRVEALGIIPDLHSPKP